MSRVEVDKPSATTKGDKPTKSVRRSSAQGAPQSVAIDGEVALPQGRSSPLGATVAHGGVNFSLFSRNATGVELVLFDRDDDARPSRVIPLDPVVNRAYHYWHVFVPEVPWPTRRTCRSRSA